MISDKYARILVLRYLFIGSVYLEVIFDIKCQLWLRRTCFSYTMKTDKTFPTTILSLMATSKRLVFIIYNFVVAENQC